MSLVANVQVKVFEDDEPGWTMYQCLVQGCTRYYCESLGGYLARSEKGTLVPVSAGQDRLANAIAPTRGTP